LLTLYLRQDRIRAILGLMLLFLSCAAALAGPPQFAAVSITDRLGIPDGRESRLRPDNFTTTGARARKEKS
jgi:hypothetical protein